MLDRKRKRGATQGDGLLILCHQCSTPCNLVDVNNTHMRAGNTHKAMEKGTKAFVSYVRGYKEHHCKYVFQLADLRLEQLGIMFGLLRLPVMKEVRQARKGQGMKDFKQSAVDPDDVPYLDKAREKARRAELAKAKKAGKDRCTVREEKRVAREAAAAAVAKKGPLKKLPAAKRQLQQHRDDLQDLDDDYKVYKKLKKGKISGEEYDAAMNIDE